MMSLFGSADYEAMKKAAHKKTLAEADEHLKQIREKKKKHGKKVRKEIVRGLTLTVKGVLQTFEAIGVFAPIMDAAVGVVEIFSGRMQEKLMPSMSGVIDALLGEEMMGALDLVAEGFSTILDPIIDALGVAIAAAPIGAALGTSIGALIGSFVGNAEIGAALGLGVGVAVGAAPIGGTFGTILGTAIGGIFGGTVGAIVGAPIGAALGAGIELLFAGVISEREAQIAANKAARAAWAAKEAEEEALKHTTMVAGTLSAVYKKEMDIEYVDPFYAYLGAKAAGVDPWAIQETSVTGDAGAINITVEGNIVGQNGMTELLDEIAYRRLIGI